MNGKALQDEIRLLRRLGADQLNDGDLVLVVTTFGEPVAMTVQNLVRGAVRLGNENRRRQRVESTPRAKRNFRRL